MPSAANLAESWVDVDAVAKHLGVARDSVYRWIEAKGLPAHRVGRLWKLKLSQTDAWVTRDGAADNEEAQRGRVGRGEGRLG